MQDYYDYYGNNGNQKPPKKGVGGIVLAIILSLLVGLLIGAMLLPGLFDVDGSVLNDLAPPWWKRALEEVRPSPTSAPGGGPSVSIEQAEVPEATPRAELPVPSFHIYGRENDPPEAYYNPVVEIAERVGPSVVGVITMLDLGEEGEGFGEIENSAGSGVILTQDGYIVTNNHVLEGSDTVFVTMNDSERVRAEIIGRDSSNDLAVIKIDRTGLTPIELGKSSEVRVGELSIAIGNPLGSRLSGTVTVGYISSVRRIISIGGEQMIFMQTDAAINPGNSGGALVNSRGRLIGINAAKSFMAGYDEYGNPISAEGIGFAIPIDVAMPLIERLIQFGDAVRPGIGITGETILAPELEAGVRSGVRVAAITRNGPAHRAGMEIGDIIYEMNGKPVTDIQEMVADIKQMRVGDVISFSVERGDTLMKIDVTLADFNKIEE